MSAAALMAAERCVVLEDAPAGIAAGRAAGAVVIALRSTHGDEALAGAAAVVDDLSALLRATRRQLAPPRPRPATRSVPASTHR